MIKHLKYKAMKKQLMIITMIASVFFSSCFVFVKKDKKERHHREHREDKKK